MNTTLRAITDVEVVRTPSTVLSSQWLIAAWVSGLFPLCAGIGIFLLWWLTRWDGLQLLGALNLVVGCVFFLAGAFCLLVEVLSEGTDRAGWRSRWGAGIVLIGNFPAAAGIIQAVGYIESQYTITIENDSAEELVDLHVTGTNLNVDFGTVRPGTRVSRRFSLYNDCQLEAVCHIRNQPVNVLVDGYAMSNRGGNVLIHFPSQGEIIVEDLRSKAGYD